MKYVFSLLLLTAMGLPALAGSESDLDECARRSDAALCMNKVLLRAIVEGRRPGGPGGPGGPGHGGPGGILGTVHFYTDDRCGSNKIGQVFFTMNAEFNRNACEKAYANGGDVWAVSVEMQGTTTCYDVSDTRYDVADRCFQALRRAGVPF